MLPEFGAGINSLLFENFSDKEMLLDLEGRIIQQINEYLPYIELNTVTFGLSEVDRNKIGLRVDYSVPDLEFVDILFVDLSEE